MPNNSPLRVYGKSRSVAVSGASKADVVLRAAVAHRQMNGPLTVYSVRISFCAGRGLRYFFQIEPGIRIAGRRNDLDLIWQTRSDDRPPHGQVRPLSLEHKYISDVVVPRILKFRRKWAPLPTADVVFGLADEFRTSAR